MKKSIAITAALLAGALTLTGCAYTNENDAIERDQEQTNSQLERYQANQPVPAFDWSQYRQTVIDVQVAQVTGVATTTFFFNMGSVQPFKVCPSIGFPVASTAQLTNPDQLTANNLGNGIGWVEGSVAQQEPNGVYSGESTCTYVVCIAPDSTEYVVYWEGSVHTEGGPAVWNPDTQMVELSGAPTVASTNQ